MSGGQFVVFTYLVAPVLFEHQVCGDPVAGFHEEHHADAFCAVLSAFVPGVLYGVISSEDLDFGSDSDERVQS